MTAAACIAFTVYRVPTITEKLSLLCLNNVLSDWDKFLVKPESLDLEINGFIPLSLPDEYFESKKTYGLLLASSIFYRSFSAYQWVLIYQPDCLVFRDELAHWCDMPYDYLSSACFAAQNPWARFDFAGFGGVSLRRVSAFLETLDLVESDPNRLMEHRSEILVYGQEDVWWNWVASKVNQSFRVLDVASSLDFSWNGDPAPYAERAHGIPFACHGFLHPKTLLYYWPYLPLTLEQRFLYAVPSLIVISVTWIKLFLRRLLKRLLKSGPFL